MFVMLLFNFVVLLVWSLLEPLEWQRFQVNGEAWNTYGICVGPNQSIYYAVLGLLNVGALILALIQAWQARNISDEFSESKSVGLALYSWLQILLVGVPVLLLIDRHNAKARYFLLVALIFLVCMTMLLIIFIPMLRQIKRAQMRRKVQLSNNSHSYSSDGRTPKDSANSDGSVRISGLNLNLSHDMQNAQHNGYERNKTKAGKESSDGTSTPLTVRFSDSNETQEGALSCV